MGNELVTVQNLEIVKIDLENNIVLIKGNVPGPKNALVVIKTAVKNPDKVNEKADLVFYEVEDPVVEETKEVTETENEEVAEEKKEDTEETTESEPAGE